MAFNQESWGTAGQAVSFIATDVTVPEDWGAASVIPTYKKGSRVGPGKSTPESQRCNRDLWVYR